ncbi:MAG: hypothetical protein J7L51_03990 [Desulfurococcales archaeon]|nr:hypothetical protein [Desulfurococcales archaeon]
MSLKEHNEECKKQLEAELSLYVLTYSEANLENAFSLLVQHLLAAVAYMYQQLPDPKPFFIQELTDKWFLCTFGPSDPRVNLCYHSLFDPTGALCQDLLYPYAFEEKVSDFLADIPQDACIRLQIIRRLQDLIRQYKGLRGDVDACSGLSISFTS